MVADEELPAKTQVESILAIGQSLYQIKFAVTCSDVKYLAERLILEGKHRISVLVVRLSAMGPAIREPCPFHGPEDSIPAHNFLHLLRNPNYRTYEDAKRVPQNVVIDEIPVDIVSNICLLHMASETTGIIHAGVSGITTPKKIQDQTLIPINWKACRSFVKRLGEQFFFP